MNYQAIGGRCLFVAASLFIGAACGSTSGAGSGGGSGDTGGGSPDAVTSDTGACVPDCEAKFCGDDGCGGSCGDCKNGMVCVTGICAAACTDKDTVCDGGTLHQCTKYHLMEDHACTTESCQADGFKDLAEPPCGPNASGQSSCLCTGCTAADTKCVGNVAQVCDTSTHKLSSQTCAGADVCKAGVCGPAICTKFCPNNACGISDGCGGKCQCSSGQVCAGGVCGPACTPSCPAKTCGDDGCGGKCACAGGLVCANGLCQAPCTSAQNYCGGGAVHICDAGTGQLVTKTCTAASCQAAGFADLDNPPCGNDATGGVTCYCKPCVAADSFCDGNTGHFCDTQSGKMVVQACGNALTCSAGQCAPSCVVSTDCPSSAPCCGILYDAKGAPIPDHGACVAGAGGLCRCGKNSECTSTICAPVVYDTTTVEPFKACKANDGQPYHGCNGFQGCVAAGTCCVWDPADPSSNFCAFSCSGSCASGAICSAKYTVNGMSSCPKSTQTCSP